ncbi:MAG: molybdenum ABC transporter ATP-binding protein [Pseudomonadota bacterium]
MSLLDFAVTARRGSFQLTVEAQLPYGITGVYGASGSGKTSLLLRIAGLMRGSSEDHIQLKNTLLESEGRWLPPEQRDVGMVFQDARLFPHLTVRGNLEFALQRQRRAGLGIDELSQMLGITAWLTRKPDELSRGQQQRVALARTLINMPRLLLLDEPGANIDAEGRRRLLHDVATLCDQYEMAALLVSHDMADLADVAETLLVLAQGQQQALGPLIELASQVSGPLAQAQDTAAIMNARVDEHDSQYGLTRLAIADQALWVDQTPAPRGSAVRLRLPARDVSLCHDAPKATSILNVLSVKVAEVQADAGNRLLVRLALGDQYLLARITRKSLDSLGLRVGDRLYAQIKSTALIDRGGSADD